MFDALTVTEFAKRQGVTRAAVHLWIRATPDLHPLKVGGLTLLTPEDQRRILASRRKIGRPKKTVDKANPAA